MEQEHQTVNMRVVYKDNLNNSYILKFDKYAVVRIPASVFYNFDFLGRGGEIFSGRNSPPFLLLKFDQRVFLRH